MNVRRELSPSRSTFSSRTSISIHDQRQQNIQGFLAVQPASGNIAFMRNACDIFSLFKRIFAEFYFENC